MWDNRQTMHRRPHCYDRNEVRDVRRNDVLAGDVVTIEQDAAVAE